MAMNDPAMMILTGALLVVGLGVLGCVLTLRRLGLMLQHLPTREALESVSKAGKAMEESIEAGTRVAESLPPRLIMHLSEEVSGGLRPTTRALESLSAELSSSLVKLQAVVLTLDQNGDFGNLVENLRASLQPLEATAKMVNSSHDTTRAILSTTNDLLKDWGTQRDSVQQAFDRFTAVLETTSVREETSLAEIEGRVMERLKEISATDYRVSQSLSELQTAEQDAQVAQKDLAKALRETCIQMEGIARETKALQTRHVELANAQREVQDGFQKVVDGVRDWQTAFDASLSKFLSALAAAPAKVSSAIEEFLNKILTDVQRLHTLLRQSHEAQAKTAEHLCDKLDTLIVQHGTSIEHHVREMHRMTASMEGLPRWPLQLTAVLLLAGQFALLLLVAYSNAHVLFK